MAITARKSVTDSTGYAGFVDTDANFVVAWAILQEVADARDGEANLLAKIDAIDASIAALTVGTGCPVSANDTTSGYLNGKLLAGEGIDFTEGNDGGDETLTILAEDASATNKGVVELATDAETITGTDTGRAITPANLQAKVASTTAKGIAELATAAEVTTGSDNARTVTPLSLQGILSAVNVWTVAQNSSVNVIGSIGGGSQEIVFSDGDVVTATVDTGETTLTFSGNPASGVAGAIILILTNPGSQTLNMPASVDYAAGTAPSWTSSGVDVVGIITTDGGTTHLLFEVGLDVQSP